MDYVEQLAKLMYEDSRAEHGDVGPWEETSRWFREDYTIQARQAINAIASLAERGGPKLVAREPNFDMGMAPKNRDTAKESGIYAGIWRTMFDAAPAVPAGVLEVVK